MTVSEENNYSSAGLQGVFKPESSLPNQAKLKKIIFMRQEGWFLAPKASLLRSPSVKLSFDVRHRPMQGGPGSLK